MNSSHIYKISSQQHLNWFEWVTWGYSLAKLICTTDYHTNQIKIESEILGCYRLHGKIGKDIIEYDMPIKVRLRDRSYSMIYPPLNEGQLQNKFAGFVLQYPQITMGTLHISKEVPLLIL